MSLGITYTVGSLIPHLMPGDILYQLNSPQVPVVVLFVLNDGVIANNGKLYLPYRVFRYKKENINRFPVDWQALIKSEEYELDFPEFMPDDFVRGLVVIYLTKDKKFARVERLHRINRKEEWYETRSGKQIPFSDGLRIISTNKTEK